MQSQSCNTFDKYTLNKSRFLIFVIFGLFAILRYLAQFEYLGNFIIATVTLLPFTLIIFYAIWIFFKDRYNHESFVLMNSCHVFLNLLLKLSFAILILFIVFFPGAWKPVWVFLISLKNLLTLETYFLFSSYAAVIIVAFGAIIVATRLYQKSQGTYQKSLGHLIKKTLYSTFFVLAFIFLFSLFAYPQAYAPITDAAGEVMGIALGRQDVSSHADTDNSVFSVLTKAVKNTKSNLFSEIAATNQELAANLNESKDSLTKSIDETAASLKDKISIEGGDITGALVLSGNKADLTVEGDTIVRNLSPAENDTYDLGEADKGWNNIYAHNLWGSSLLSIGSGSSSHGLTGPDDLLISGALEVNGGSYFGSSLIPGSNAVNLGSDTNHFGAVYADSLVGVSLDYLPTTGGTVTGGLTINSTDNKLLSLKKNGTEKAYVDNDGIISAKGLKLNGTTRRTWVDPSYQYEAVVDPDGNGDYTNLNDAIDAGNQRIFLKNGTYRLTRDAIMSDPTKSFALIGESRTGTFIDPDGYYFSSEGTEIIKNAGSIALTNGSQTVIGSSVNFITGGAVAGMWLRVGDNTQGYWYKIKTIVSATQLTLELPHEGGDIAGQASYGIGYAYEDPRVENITFINSAAMAAGTSGSRQEPSPSSDIFMWGNSSYSETGLIRLTVDNCYFNNSGSAAYWGPGRDWRIINSSSGEDTYFFYAPTGSSVENNIIKGGLYVYPRSYIANNVIYTFISFDNGDGISSTPDMSNSVVMGNKFVDFTPNFANADKSGTVSAMGNKRLDGTPIADVIPGGVSGIKSSGVNYFSNMTSLSGSSKLQMLKAGDAISGTGTVYANANEYNTKNILGLGTAFTTELLVGEAIIVGDEERIITAISNDTSLTIDSAFINIGLNSSEGSAFTYREVGMVIQNGGANVGIGTDAPLAALDILKSGAETDSSYGLRIQNETGNITADAINKYGTYISSTGNFTGGAGGATNNYGLYIDAVTGADNNYPLYINSATANSAISIIGSAADVNTSNPYIKIQHIGSANAYIGNAIDIDLDNAGDGNASTGNFLRGINNDGAVMTTLGANGDASFAGNVTAANFFVGATQLSVPDYVFDGSDLDYEQRKMKSLDELKTYIDMNHHLPGIASEAEIRTSGVLDYSSMLMSLLEKTEENTLYILQNNDQINTINSTLTLNGINDNIDNLETDTENSITKLKKNLKETDASISDIRDVLTKQITDLNARLNADILANTKNLNDIRIVLGIREGSDDINIQGKLAVEALEAGGIAIKVVDNKKTIGHAEINANEKSTGFISDTVSIKESSRVYITPTSPTFGEVPYVNIDGDKFEIKIDNDASDSIKLNWWIVEEKAGQTP